MDLFIEERVTKFKTYKILSQQLKLFYKTTPKTFNLGR